MHTFYNIKTNKETTIPSDIYELTPDQYLEYLKLVHAAETENIPVKQLRMGIFRIICPIDFGFKYARMSKAHKEELWIRLYQLSEKMDSFFDIEESEDKLIYKAHLKCGSNLLPEWNGLKGPDDMLNNITWGDFVTCMNLLSAYKEALESNNSLESDSILTDFFYRLYKSDSGTQKKEVPAYVKLHAVSYFSYIFELISSVPISIHGNEIDFRILFSGQGSTAKDNNMGWNGLVFSVAESGVFGKTEDVNKESFWQVMLYLYKCTFDNQNITKK